MGRSRSAGAHKKNHQRDGRAHENYRRPGGETGEHIGCSPRAEGCLRALAAKGAGQIGRPALLDEHDADEEQANDHVYNEHNVEKNLLHSQTAFEVRAKRRTGGSWCGRGDLNPYAFWAPPPQDGVSANFTTSALGSAFDCNIQAETVVEGRLRRFLLCSGGLRGKKREALSRLQAQSARHRRSGSGCQKHQLSCYRGRPRTATRDASSPA